MGHEPPQLWDRRDDESGPAHRTFLFYRDVEPARNLDRAGLEIAPPPGGGHGGRKRCATDRIREWFKRWEWSSRAVARDRHRESVRQQATALAIVSCAERRVQRRDEVTDEVREGGRQLLGQATLLVQMPLLDVTKNQDGVMDAIAAGRLGACGARPRSTGRGPNWAGRGRRPRRRTPGGVIGRPGARRSLRSA